ncbi:MAG: ATP-dependent RNA helicase RhlE [Planctomycetota bacterium]|nr:MAG: ATP-dependent RNA helicase RhlE [Planctomycetota bacterium]
MRFSELEQRIRARLAGGRDAESPPAGAAAAPAAGRPRRPARLAVPERAETGRAAEGERGAGAARARAGRAGAAPAGEQRGGTAPATPAGRPASAPPGSTAGAAGEGFGALGLPPALLRAVAELGFRTPTPIQQRAIPPALAGRDVVGQARTGTGKTAAFGLPLLARLEPGAAQAALVLAPTRELARQVADHLEMLARHTAFRVALVYGGVSYEQQRRALAAGAEIVVGTPGRVLDLERQRVLELGQLRVVVLDECDRMFDLGFRPDIERVLRASAPGREQLLLFSATIDEAVLRVAHRYMREPVIVRTAPEQRLTVDEVEQHFCVVARERKTALLAELIRRERAQGALQQAIVFARTKSGCDRLAQRLNKLGLHAHPIHGDLRQERRERVLRQLRARRVQLLVATNVAARGLDIEGVSHVFNYDVPEYPEDYVHRVGRTARMGARGKAFTLVEPGQGRLLDQIEKLTGVQLQELRIAGFDHGLEPGRAAEPGRPASGTILYRSAHG